MAAGSRCMFVLNNIIRSKAISPNYKLRSYGHLLCVLAETQILNESDSKQLRIREKRLFAEDFWAQLNKWRIKSNTNLEELYGSPDLDAGVKARRLEWLGPIEKSKSCIRTDRRREIGRPKRRWSKGLEECLRMLGIRQLRRKAEDRNAWTAITEEVKALHRTKK